MTDTSLPMNAETVTSYLKEIGFWPQFELFGLRIAETRERYARTTLKINQLHVRLGNTISGPTQFTAADTALYLATLATLGPVGVAVTSQLNIHFLAAGKGDIMVTEASLLKIGKRSVIGEMKMSMEGSDEPISVATGTFAIPRTAAP